LHTDFSVIPDQTLKETIDFINKDYNYNSSPKIKVSNSQDICISNNKKSKIKLKSRNLTNIYSDRCDTNFYISNLDKFNKILKYNIEDPTEIVNHLENTFKYKQ